MEGCETSVKDCKQIYDNGDNLIYVMAQINIDPKEMANNIKCNDTEKDWSYRMTEQECFEYCTKSIEKAKLLELECITYGLKFYDTAQNRKKVLEEIMEDIEKNINS